MTDFEVAAETDQPHASRNYRKWAARGMLLLVAAGLTAGVWQWLGARGRTSRSGKPLLAAAHLGPFIHEVIERGDIASSSNVDVRSEVRQRTNNGGVAILEIVPEGAYVRPGDFLVRLDDSALQFELLQQQISVKNSEALVSQAETSLETAELAVEEFESGTYKQGVEELQALLLVAQENLRRAEEYLHYSERLAAKGYVTNIQLDADRFAVLKAKKDFAVAETKLNILTNFTKEKTLKRLESDVQAAEAKLRATKDSHQIELDRLKNVEEQIAKCRITAPVNGQVVYANDSGRSSDVLIEEGRMVRERQTIIRLPDHEKMQVVAKVNESHVDLIEPGQTVAIRVDALPGVELTGVVRKVAEYPLPTSSYTAHVKNYATEIEIHDPPKDLRPGMTAEVAVLVEHREQALQVPVQSVVERAGHFFCIVQAADEDLAAREVEIGATNDKFVVIESGLAADDQVCVSPQPYLTDMDLPEADDTSEPRLALHERARQAIKPSVGSARKHLVKKPVLKKPRGDEEFTETQAGGL